MKRNDHSRADLTKRPLSFTEAAILADNLETVEYFRDLQRNPRNPSVHNPDARMSLVGKIVFAFLWLILLYGFGALLYAVISVLFLCI